MTAYNFIDITGQHFGRLQVVERAPQPVGGEARWLCRCDCGTEVVVRSRCLRTGRTQSCGCFHHEWFRNMVTKHGLRHTVEYNTYYGLRSRCLNPKDAKFLDYGGRGITVEWQSFEEFVRDMGPRPGPEYSIERVNNDGPYSAANCVWATQSQQMNNTRRSRRVEYHGELLTFAQVAERTGLSYGAVKSRVKRGMSLLLPYNYHPYTIERHGSRTHPEAILRGSKNQNAKLTEDQVREIRRLRTQEQAGYRRLAEMFGVSQTLIATIIRRESWTHI